MTKTRHFFAEARSPGQQRAGLTLIEFFVAIAILLLLLILLLPAPTRSRVAARRTQCRNNLKQIGLALHNYLTDHGVLPPAFTVDDKGQRLHSWRTLILPYLDQTPLFEAVDLSKPWDDPANAALLASKPSVYHCPSANTPWGQTIYLAVVTPNSVIRADHSLALDDIADGPEKSLAVVEVPVTQAVPWMSPADADEAMVLSVTTKTKTVHDKGITVLLADGSVKFLPNTVSADLRRALVTAAADDKVGDF